MKKVQRRLNDYAATFIFYIPEHIILVDFIYGVMSGQNARKKKVNYLEFFFLDFFLREFA